MSMTISHVIHVARGKQFEWTAHIKLPHDIFNITMYTLDSLYDIPTFF